MTTYSGNRCQSGNLSLTLAAWYVPQIVPPWNIFFGHLVSSSRRHVLRTLCVPLVPADDPLGASPFPFLPRARDWLSWKREGRLRLKTDRSDLVKVGPAAPSLALNTGSDNLGLPYAAAIDRTVSNTCVAVKRSQRYN